MGVLNKLKGRMSGYNALTKGPAKHHGPAHCDVDYMHSPYWNDMRKRNAPGPGKVEGVSELEPAGVEELTVDNKPRKVDLEKVDTAVEQQTYTPTDRMAKTDEKISDAKSSGKKGGFWSSYETKEDRLKDRKKRQVGRAERKEIRKESKEGKITKEEKRDKIKASRKKQKPTGKQKKFS